MTHLSAPAYVSARLRRLRMTALREYLLHIDRQLSLGDEAPPWIARAVAVARTADPDVHHARRVSELSVRVARLLDSTDDPDEGIAVAAELHDLGKHSVPRTLLTYPGPLTEKQRRRLALHTRAGAWLLAGLEDFRLRLAHDVAKWHHERWDGSGYPDRLRGHEIPFAARLVAVCDVWDALTSDRAYRPALVRAEAAATVRTMAGVTLDGRIVDGLLHLVDA